MAAAFNPLQVHLSSKSCSSLGLSHEHSQSLFKFSNAMWTFSQSFQSSHAQNSWWRSEGSCTPACGPITVENNQFFGRIRSLNGLRFMGSCGSKATFADDKSRVFNDRAMPIGWMNRERSLGLLGFCGFNPTSVDETIRVFRDTSIHRKTKTHASKGKVSASLASTIGDNEDGATISDSKDSNNRIPGNIEGQGSASPLERWSPPRYLWRALAALVIAGQVVIRSCQGRIHLRNSLQQLEQVGPRSVGVCLLTAAFVGMAFTIQFVREFSRLGLNRSVGGVLALAFSRELSPVVTAIIIAGRVGSAFAAELGTMQVSEQTDTLRVLGTDPIDYLVIPRVIACCVALPILTLVCFTVGMAASALLADAVFQVSANIILDSAKRALQPWDLISAMIKSTVFGGLISVISCAWGVTTLGGAKGVGESTTSAVVISLVCIFIADFILSWCFFQGAGDALKAAMG